MQKNWSDKNKNGGITVPPFLLNAEALIAIFLSLRLLNIRIKH
jgi:hypothetical protein